MAKFGDDLAQAYGVIWHDDLFAPAGEDGRYTTDVDGFFGAQREWMEKSLPERSTLLQQDQHGSPQLPKKAERVFGKSSPTDCTGHYVDNSTGEVKTISYRMPEERKAGKPTKGSVASESDGEAEDTAVKKPGRAEITQQGVAMIGALRTDALREALTTGPIEDDTLMALLILALGASNVTIQPGGGLPSEQARPANIAASITHGGVISADTDAIRQAARKILVYTLSCQVNVSNSGFVARIAGETIGASVHLPTMATEEFLSCLSKPGIERVAAAEGVKVHPRGKDTRAAVIERFKGDRYILPTALFLVRPDEEAANRPSRNYWVNGSEGSNSQEEPLPDKNNSDDATVLQAAQ